MDAVTFDLLWKAACGLPVEIREPIPGRPAQLTHWNPVLSEWVAKTCDAR